MEDCVLPILLRAEVWWSTGGDFQADWWNWPTNAFRISNFFKNKIPFIVLISMRTDSKLHRHVETLYFANPKQNQNRTTFPQAGAFCFGTQSWFLMVFFFYYSCYFFLPKWPCWLYNPLLSKSSSRDNFYPSLFVWFFFQIKIYVYECVLRQLKQTFFSPWIPMTPDDNNKKYLKEERKLILEQVYRYHQIWTFLAKNANNEFTENHIYLSPGWQLGLQK